MTFDPSDISSLIPTSRSHIQTANGKCVRVQNVGSIDVFSLVHLKIFIDSLLAS